MKIAIAGQGRAGSTVLWKMVHKMVNDNGISAPKGTNRENAVASKAYILKIHPYEKRVHEWAEFILAPRRDIREAVDSYERIIPRRVVDPRTVRNCCQEMTNLYGAWKDRCTYEMVYERFRETPEEVIAEIADHLGLECDPKIMIKEFGRPPAKKPMVLRPEWVKIIEDEYGWWLREYGYPIPGDFKYRQP